VVAPYRREGQARQAKTGPERDREAWALAERKDLLLAGLDTLTADGRLSPGGQRARWLREQVTAASSHDRLEEIAGLLLELAPPPGTPSPSSSHDRAVPGHQDGGDRERLRAELHELADAELASLTGRRHFHTTPAGPAAGHLAPGERRPVTSTTANGQEYLLGRPCQRCRQAPAAVIADCGDISAALLTEARGLPGGFCTSCAHFLQATYPGHWQVSSAGLRALAS
jgi:hypothetical protein